MKRSSLAIPVAALCCLSCLCAVGGCPLDLQGIDPASFQPAPELAGVYWIEHTDAELAIYRLPEYRGDPGEWLTIKIEPPAEYTGPALYEIDTDGSWTRLTDGDDLTLDEVLQLWDPGPLPPSAEESPRLG